MTLAWSKNYFKCIHSVDIGVYYVHDTIFNDPIYKWCNENITGLWYMNYWNKQTTIMRFELKEDMVLFKLTW